MYWYYKYPLLAIGLVILIGLGYLVWKQLPRDVTDELLKDGETVGTQQKRPGPPDSATSSQRSASNETAGRPATDARRDPARVATPDAMTTRRLEKAEQQLQKENLLAARALARKVLAEDGDVPWFSETWDRAVTVVSEANTKLFNTDAPAPEKVSYIVESGDTLSGVADKYNTTIAAIQRSNDLDPTDPTIYPGSVLHIYKGDWNIRVFKEKFALVLMNGERVFKRYEVGIGRQNRTPAGVFRVKNKLREPAWTPPGRIIPYGDEENVLGTRWLGLEPIEDTRKSYKGYGIHGTWEPETIGTAASQGCIRMHNDDVNELFDIVPIGSRVVILNE